MVSISKRQIFEQTIHISNTAPSLLRTLFLHHDGIIVGATVAALQRHGVLDTLLDQKRLSMHDLLNTFSCNPGYLHVALRCLALQGWIQRHGPLASDDMVFEITPTGVLASTAFSLYTDVAGFVYSGTPMDQTLFGNNQNDEPDEQYANLINSCVKNWSLPNAISSPQAADLYEIIARHLDGMLAGTTMIAAQNRGLLNGDCFSIDTCSNSNPNLLLCMDLLQHLGWVHGHEEKWFFTDLGKLAGEFSLHYGLTLSYFPMLCNLHKLIFNSAKNITHVQPGKEEIHVDRTLNVLASGVAHKRYFEDSDKIIIDIFNQEPIAEQAKFVADMGCGDGTWLKRIYQVVKDKTMRGRKLDQYPLLMVGADYNVKAQDVAHGLLHDAGIPHLVLFGDVTDPRQFAGALEDHNLNICDGLHIRAFIDHNRHYTVPRDREKADRRTNLSTGAYADENGDPVKNKYLEQHLVEHFKKWVPYVQKHGLIIIEAHNVDPRIASLYNGKTHATAFDTYHGYSNQYPLDFDAFMCLAEEAGLRSISYQQCLYPSRLPFVAISINRFKSTDLPSYSPTFIETNKKIKEWIPSGLEDLQDGDALHHFLYENGDISRPKSWCFRATGMLVETVLKQIEQRILRIKTQQSVHRSIILADYGAGTGLASLELIKGLNEKGLLKQIEECRINFQLLLFDFPSAWFAKGYQLLNHFSFVKYYSLANPETGNIRLVSEIIDDQKVNIIIASMVFHLVPPKALPVLFESLDYILHKDGCLIWNSPDTTPTMPYSEVIHASNRQLRQSFLAYLDKPESLKLLLSKLPDCDQHGFADLPHQIETIKNRLDEQSRRDAQRKADKQILPTPTNLETIEQALAERFQGKNSIAMSVLRDQDLLDLALLPSNQRYINEVDDRACREKLIHLILKYDIIPKLNQSPVGHPSGINLHWTFGQYTKRLSGSK